MNNCEKCAEMERRLSEEHREWRWCADLHCGKCYSSDTWQNAEVTQLRAQLEQMRATSWAPLTEDECEAVVDGMPGGQDGYAKTWGWMTFAIAIQERLRLKNAPEAPLRRDLVEALDEIRAVLRHHSDATEAFADRISRLLAETNPAPVANGTTATQDRMPDIRPGSVGAGPHDPLCWLPNDPNCPRCYPPKASAQDEEIREPK
jgi:hypothetical protein